MKCESEGCNEEATVHETIVRKGKKVERHLCESCARKQGIIVQSPLPIGELLGKFMLTKAEEAPTQKSHVCTGCGMTWSKFRQVGLLGCPECYRTFEEELVPLLERAHEGGSRHVGKTPSRAGHTAAALQSRLAALRQQLQEAVAAEQYERAAALRDQLRQLASPPATLRRREASE